MRSRALKIITPAFIVMLLYASSCFAEGLSSLIKVGKSQEETAKILEKETEIFEAVKEGIEKGEIKEGLSQPHILREYGEPVITLPESDEAEKWVYKPAYATWFEKEKIYLLFDSERNLREIRALEGKK